MIGRNVILRGAFFALMIAQVSMQKKASAQEQRILK